MAARGKFITFDGIDGSGKSTQIRLLADWLTTHGTAVVATREPGGTPLGERLRALLLEPGPQAPTPAAELAMINAARAQHIEQVIAPALARGAWVLCDRFLDATVAYQGGGRGLSLELIHSLHRLLCGGLQPDFTLLLDLDPAAALARAQARLAADHSKEARFELEGSGFFDRVRAAYQAIAEREPERCALLSAAAAPEAIAAEVRLRLHLQGQ